MKLAPGDAFLNPDRPQHGMPKHLWVILSDPEKDPQKVLIANITSDPKWETTCLLECGDHRYIHRTSYVNYKAAKCTTAHKLQELLDSRKLQLMRSFDLEVFKRILTGAERSTKLLRKYKDLLHAQGLIP